MNYLTAAAAPHCEGARRRGNTGANINFANKMRRIGGDVSWKMC